MESSTRGIILIFLSSVAFGSYGTWARLIGDDFGVLYQGWTRALIIVLILFPFLYFRKEIVKVDRSDWRWMSVYLFFTAFTAAPTFYAFNHMDIGTATLLFFGTTVLTMYVVGFIFLSEKMTKIKLFSFFLSLLGMYMVFSFSLQAFTLLAASMAILNGIASGGEIAFSKKLPSKYSALYLTWLSWLIIVPTNGIMSILLGEKQIIPSFDVVWLYQLGFAVAGIIGFWFVVAGLRYVEASIGGLLGLLEIIFSILFGILIFKEVLTTNTIVGGIIIISAAAVPHISSIIKNKNRHK